MRVDIEVTSEEVIKRLLRLKPDKSPGTDNMYSRVLKEMADVISKPLTRLFNKTLQDQVVPSDWRKANVTTIFKKGSKSSASNYRPVSLTSHVCKLLESIIRYSLVAHLSKHTLLNKSQHGFTSGKSCLTNLLKFLEDVTKYIDEGKPVDVIYLDFSKAFDKIPHKRLISKVKAYAIGGKIYGWIEQWLHDREQRVVVNGQTSEWAKVSSGVPQGSVLGPTLFLMYINDIDERVTSGILKFADDTKIYTCVQTVEAAMILQEDLNRLCSWSKDWLMLFNVDKCKCLHFGFNNIEFEYMLGNDTISSCLEEKDLGITVHHSLQTSSHCANIVKKANQVLGIIRRTYDDKSKENIVQLYKSLVRPHLEYCMQAWRPYLQKYIDKFIIYLCVSVSYMYLLQ